MESKIINTFSGGLNTDTSINKYSNDNYYDARNVRILTNDSLSSMALSNFPAPATILGSTGNVTQAGTILGVCNIRDTIIVFFVGSSGISYIYKKRTTDTNYILVYSDVNSNSKLGFNATYPIHTVGRYESEEIQKVYWCDYLNVNCSINIANTYDMGIGTSVEAYLFYNNPYAILDSPVITSVTSGGSLYSGNICYTYQLYIKNGGETALSLNSSVVPLSSRIGSELVNFRGDEIGVNSGNAVTLSFSNLDTNYNRIRIYSIHYTDGNLSPIINVINESEISSATYSYTDNGNISLSTLTPSEYSVLGGRIFASKTLETKYNYLFPGNIKEYRSDVEFDARTYRFKREYEPNVEGLVSALDTDGYITITFDKSIGSKASGSVRLDYTVGLSSIPTYDYTLYYRTGLDYFFEFPAYHVTDWPYIFHTGGWNNSTTYDTNHVVYYNTKFWISTSDGNINNEPGVVPLAWANFIDIGDSYKTIASLTIPSCTVYSSAGVARVVTVSNWNSVPEDHDCLNYFNDFQYDLNIHYLGDRTNTYDYKYQSNGTTLGGSGPNISYSFVTKSLETDTAVASGYAKRYIENKTNSLLSPILSSIYKGYKRGEVYRFGIEFVFKNGSKSFVKWIGDIRFPFIEEEPLNEVISLINYNKQLGIQFEVNLTNLTNRDEIAGYNIVRVDRTSLDKNIICQGLGGGLIKNGGTSSYVTSNVAYDALGFACHRIPNIGEIKALVKDNTPAGYADQNISAYYYELNSPEISFNKEQIYYNTGDELRIIGGEYESRESYTARDSYSHLIHNPVTSTLQAFRELSDITNYKLNDVIEDYETAGGNFEGSPIYYRAYCGNLCNTIKNKCGLIKLSAPFPLSGITTETQKLILEYTRRRFTTQYGGNTYSNRQLNSYINTINVLNTSTNTNSSFITIDYHNLYTTNVFGGDTYVCQFDLLRCGYDLNFEPHGDGSQEYLSFAVETSMNLEYRRDEFLKYLTFYDAITPAYPAYYLYNTLADGIKNYPLTYSENLTDLYLYNNAYSRTFDIATNTSKPFDFVEDYKFDTMLLVSDKKQNGEYSDSWLKYNFNNFLEVDSTYGPLNALLNHNNKLIFFQDNGYGVIAVEDRVTVPDSNNNILSLGTGGALERFDYISTNFGALRQSAVISTEDNLYFVDENNKCLRRLSDSNEGNLSKQLGVSNLFNTLLPSTNIELGFDPEHKELLITLDTDTICFNTLLNRFTSMYDIYSDQPTNIDNYFNIARYTKINDSLYGIRRTTRLDLLKFNSAVTPLGLSSDVVLLIHPNGNNIFRFNVLDIRTNSFDGFLESLPDTTETNTDTLSQIIYRNSYITPVTVVSSLGSNIRRIARVWRTKVPLTSNNKRFVDTYLQTSIKFDNTTGNKYVLHDITSYVSLTKV